MTGLLFILALAALAGGLEWWLRSHSLDAVQEDLYPEKTVADPGEVFYLRIRLRNTGRWPVPYVRVSLFFPREIRAHDEAHAVQEGGRMSNSVSYAARLRPYQELTIRVPVSMDRRGLYVLPRLTVRGGDFLGVTEQARELMRFNEVVVAPAPAPEQPVQALLGGLLGDVSVHRFLYEDPILTAGYREYTGREPMKQIAWAQCARGRGLMVKQPDYTTDPVVTVLVNTELRDAAQFAQREACLSLARTVCQILEQRAVPYELETNASLEYVAQVGNWKRLQLRRGLGEAHFRQALEILGRARERVRMPGEALLMQAACRDGVHSRILVTTADGMPPEKALARLRAASGGRLLVLTPQEVETV